MRELERDRSDIERTEPSTGIERPTPLPQVVVIGPGRVGGAVGRAAEGAGLAHELAGHNDALAACRRARVALLCVPDSAIGDACETVASAIPPLRAVGHVSGATPLAALAAARKRGASTFSIHPLQTIPSADTDLAGVPCAVTASDADTAALAKALAGHLGMHPFDLREDDRAAYHAAASIASNFLIALEESASELLDRIGLDDPRELLSPLVLRTAVNWSEGGAEALTGPIARGDDLTVERHLQALEETAPELVPLYRALADRTRAIAARRTSGTEVRA